MPIQAITKVDYRLNIYTSFLEIKKISQKLYNDGDESTLIANKFILDLWNINNSSTRFIAGN